MNTMVASMPGRWPFFAALVAATSYLLLSPLHPLPGQVLLKTSMCLLLALYAWQANRKLLTIAMLCSAAGDAFLGIDGERLFVPGLASFLVAHLFYAAIFIRSGDVALSRARKAAFAGIVVFALGYASLLWPALGALRWPVAVYMTVITLMALLSLRMKAWHIPLGAILFMASDSLIALGKFLWTAPWIGPAIWITYAAAQLLIAWGLVRRPLP